MFVGISTWIIGQGITAYALFAVALPESSRACVAFLLPIHDEDREIDEMTMMHAKVGR